MGTCSSRLSQQPPWLQRTSKLLTQQLSQPPLALRRRQRLIALLRGVRQPLQQKEKRSLYAVNMHVLQQQSGRACLVLHSLTQRRLSPT